MGRMASSTQTPPKWPGLPSSSACKAAAFPLAPSDDATTITPSLPAAARGWLQPARSAVASRATTRATRTASRFAIQDGPTRRGDAVVEGGHVHVEGLAGLGDREGLRCHVQVVMVVVREHVVAQFLAHRVAGGGGCPLREATRAAGRAAGGGGGEG